MTPSSMATSPIRAPPGLDGVIVADTMISKIDGQAGKLIYRGYSVPDIAGKIPFEAVAFLLWVGHMPNPEEFDTFKANLSKHRPIPDELRSFLEKAPRKAEPLVVLRTAVSYLEMIRPKTRGNDDPVLENGIALAAQFPTIIAYYKRLRNGEDPIEPRAELSHAVNYLYMLSGNIPNEEHANALDAYFTLLADHGMNASTFSARVTISTLTDIYSAVVAAIGTLKGPLHGGAPSEVWQMIESIGEREMAASLLSEKLRRGERIMGFGHRIYRTEDPRSKVLKDIASRIENPKTFALATTVESEARRLLQAEHPERPLDVNVEFFSSLVLHSVGIPLDMFTATFSCSRVFGWIAHIMEQLSNNRIFRPTSEYIGPPNLAITTDKERYLPMHP